MSAMELLWNNAKVWRTIRLGPVSIVYRLARSVRVSNNFRRRISFSVCNPNHISAARHFSPSAALSVAETQPRNVPAEAETALIIGAGPGLGHATAKTLAAFGMRVGLACRNAESLDGLANELTRAGKLVRAYGCDATDETSVKKVFRYLSQDFGTPNLVIYAVQEFHPGHAVDVQVAAFEESWRRNCLGGFVVAREAARLMIPVGRGTIVLIGATSAMFARAGHLNLAVGKFGLRAVAQVMARELWSRGIHVVHLIIDGEIRESATSDIDDVYAEPEDVSHLIYSIHKQRKTAWTSEVDARPWNETFWQHC